MRDAFDADYYLDHNPDVAADGGDAFLHFFRMGWREGRDPRPDFSVSHYMSMYPDVAAADINPFAHYLLYGRSEGRTPSRQAFDRLWSQDAFDADYYARQNPDVSADDALEHFLSYGWREGRDPRADFSVRTYLEFNADVAASGVNPFVHYLQHGRAEGRRFRVIDRTVTPAAADGAADTVEDAVQAAFDEAHYRGQALDLAADADAFAHYMEMGWRQGLDPNGWFSSRRYLDMNPDVMAAGANPLAHYVLHGKAEGRPLSQGPDFRSHILRAAPPFEDHLQRLRLTRPDPAPGPIATAAAALEAAAVLTSKRLHVTVSQDNYSTAFGGIQLCLRLESAAVRASGYDHLHLYPATQGTVVEIERHRPPIGVVLNDADLGVFAVQDLIDLFAGRAGDIERPNEVVSFAVHSLIGHVAADVIELLRALGAQAGFYWVHDYSSLCANYTLMRNEVSFCGAPHPESAACGVCQFRPRRRAQMAEHARLLEAFEMTVLTPSDSALSLWRRTFPDRSLRTVAHPHATLVSPRAPGQGSGPSGGPLRVAFLGMATHHKGWPVFTALADAFRNDPRYAFHHLARRPGAGAVVHFTEVAPTRENPEPMQQAIETLAIDVAVLWSLWPETFCFTAMEAIAGGAAVVANPAAGNLTAIARRDAAGLVVDGEAALYALFETGDILKQSRALRRPELRSLAYSAMTADFLPGVGS